MISWGEPVASGALTPRQQHTDIRVLVVNRQRLFAEAISTALEKHGLRVAGLATTAREAFDGVREVSPDLVLLDLALADADAIDVGEAIMAESPETTVVAVGGLADADALRAAIRAGFHGFLTKDARLSEFMSTIHAALAGEVVLPHRLASAAAGARSPETEEAALLLDRLTDRELDVLKLLTKGNNGDEIGRRLSISQNTVRTHIRNILTKLQVHSRLQAVAFAAQYKLVDLDGSRHPAADDVGQPRRAFRRWRQGG